MYPVSAISSNGNAIRYYKCITTKKKNCLTEIINKKFIENIIDKFLISQKVNVYEDKIEIFLNYSLNANITIAETISKELFTETFTSTRKFKGGTTKTITKTYIVYLIT